MSDSLSGLEPRPLWEHFARIAEIPRPSGHETKAAEYVRQFASQHGLRAHSDEVGNVIIDVPASPGKEKAPVVILQGHLDMVGEKNKDVKHDFERDPIRPRVQGDWVTGTGTTLGADNGIGVAAALAAATDPSVVRPPLQLLFTIDEETGMTGAKNLKSSLLRGHTMINLDSEEDGVIYVGCAGGADTILWLDPGWRTPGPGGTALTLEVTGLRGGHSGLNIHENRGNALKLVARTLYAACDRGIPFDLAAVHGGSKHNAIPREADAVVLVPGGSQDKLRALVDEMLGEFRLELQGIDDGLQMTLTPASMPAKVMEQAGRDRFLELLLALPHGVLGMSPAIPGLVETSNNVAVVETGDRMKLVTSSRSSVMPTLRGVLATIRAQAQLAGAEVDSKDGYPGWKPNLSSPVLGVVRDVYRKLWGQDPKVTAIHAGLECGLLGEKVQGLDMVSFGPQIEGAHSPEERVHVPSVSKFYDALKQVLEKLA